MNRILLSMLSLCLAPLASHAQTFKPDHGVRAMLYWQMPLESKAPSSYGLRLDSAPISIGSNTKRLPLLDLRYGASRTTVRLNGALMWDSIESSEFGTAGSLTNGWFWAGAALGVAGISCLSENWPCKRSSSGGGGPTYTPPGE